MPKVFLTADSLKEWFEYKEGNIHGHLHSNSVNDAWYTCVSVEQTDFKPILFEELVHKIRTKPSKSIS